MYLVKILKARLSKKENLKRDREREKSSTMGLITKIMQANLQLQLVNKSF